MPEMIAKSTNSDELLELARDLDRFSRRFERYFIVQLEQLDAEFRKLQLERDQWERQRDRDLRQIQESQRALQDAWQELKDGHAEAAARIEAPDFTSGQEEEQFCPKSASDPMRLLLQPGAGTEMLLGQLLLTLSRLNRAMGGSGIRFELADIHQSGSATILSLDAFPARPLSVMMEGEVSDDLVRWKQFKSDVALLPLGRGLDEILARAEPIGRDHELAITFVSAARRAQDGDARTSSAVKRGSKSVKEYSEQLVDLVERHQDEGLALQSVAS